MNGMMIGWHEGREQICDNSASSLSPVCLDLGAMSSPNRFEWGIMNLDTGATGNTFSPCTSDPERAGNWRFYRTVSDECIPDRGA